MGATCGSRCSRATVWATRSATVGTPSKRTPLPPALGISTASTGGGKYEPEESLFQILNKLFFRSASNSSIDCSSTPAAPLLALTLTNASQTTFLSIWNGLLSCGFGPLTWLLPATPVDHQTNQGDPSASLRPHYQASPLLPDGPPLCPASVLRPSQIPLLGVLPLPGRSNTRPGVSRRQVPTFRAGA